MLTSKLRAKMHSANVARQRTHLVIEQARAANVAFELAETRTATMQARGRSRRHGSLRSPRVWTGTAAEECDAIDSLCLRMPTEKAAILREIQARLRRVREDVATNKGEKLRLEKLQLEGIQSATAMQQEVSKGEALIAELQSALNAKTASVKKLSATLEAMEITTNNNAPLLAKATNKENDLNEQLAQVLTEWQVALVDALGDGESQPCEAGDATNANNPSPPHLPAVLQD